MESYGNTYNTDRTPGEESSESRDSQEPVKDNTTRRGEDDVGESTPDKDEEDGYERTARLVDVGEALGSVALVREGGKGSRTTVDTRDTDGDDRDADDSVHEVVETLETGIKTSQDERRDTISVGVGRVEEALIGGADKQADEGKTKNVEAIRVISKRFCHDYREGQRVLTE